MRATHVPATGTVLVKEWPDPHPTRDGEFVVRLVAASVCGSDLHSVLHGTMHPTAPERAGYPGHEGVGVVTESRSETFPVGTAVLCVPPGELGGTFAEFMLLDDLHAVALPEHVDPDDLTEMRRYMMAQQMGTCLYAMNLYWPTEIPARRAGTCVIMGAGSAGLFFLQDALLRGFEQVIVSDKEESRLQIARELGAHTVRVPQENLPDVVSELTGGEGADLVIEAVGSDALRAEAVEIVANRGIVGWFGLYESFDPAPVPVYEVFRKSVRLQGSVAAQSEPGLVSFHEAVRRIRDGEVSVDYCLGSVHTLEETEDVLRLAERGGEGTVKFTIVP
ncbi:zinc-binding alcohol dehydrogenase [Kocuria tytonicola]|uniref:zinc-binding dehydrogenase n=1 Tax=Kocuria tytonicola TaxID=2055946 RepID=UPI000EF885F1|nr:zinc-binding dehydrogenase [Kocuria tytonicola]RLZ02713.1 zinc-binding alcohol dehydrogenase [Kocuria tytonicola]